jgi:hypothetical protein
MQAEEINVKNHKEEIAELQSKLNKLQTMQEALQGQSNEIDNDIHQYIFLLKKYASS